MLIKTAFIFDILRNIYYHYSTNNEYMLDFSKNILQKVSFDKKLFHKELGKAINWLKGEELLLLKAWCLVNFGHLYRDSIVEVFEKVSEQIS